MIKKIAVVILIFIGITIAPEASGLLNWAYDNTAKLIQTVGSAIPAFGQGNAVTVTQVPATPSPSPSATATVAPSPTPTATPSPSPSAEPDLFGSFTGQTYTNEAAGLTFDFPQGYQPYGRQEIINSLSDSSNTNGNAVSDPSKIAGLAANGTVPVFIATKHPAGYDQGYNANINVTAVHTEETNPGSIIDKAALLKLGLSNTGIYTSMQDPQAVEIGGAQAALINAAAKTGSVSLSLKIYLFQNGNEMITFILSAANKTEMNEMTAAVKTVKLTTPTVQTAADTLGSISGQVYTNQTGGFTFRFPEWYTATTDGDAIREYTIAVFEAQKEMYKDPDTVLAAIKAADAAAFIAYGHPEGNKEGFDNEISISLTKMDSSSGDAMDYARNMQQIAPLFSDDIKTYDPSVVEIDGLKGACMQDTYQVGGYTVQEKTIVFEKNGYIVSIGFSWVNEAGQKEMEEALGTIRLLAGT